MSKTKLIFATILLSGFFSQAFAVRNVNVRDGSEEVLYGTENISLCTIKRIVDTIDVPETDPMRKKNQTKK